MTVNAKSKRSCPGRKNRKTVAVSGPTDHIVSTDGVLRLSNGDPMMTRVTGVGCALGAITAAFAACAPPAEAAFAATAVWTIAAEVATAARSLGAVVVRAGSPTLRNTSGPVDLWDIAVDTDLPR